MSRIEVFDANGTKVLDSTYATVGLILDGSMRVSLQGSTPPPQGESCEQFIDRMYVQYLGRHPQGGEEAWWLEQCKLQPKPPGLTREYIEAQFKQFAPPTPLPPTQGNPAAIVPWQPWNQTAKFHTLPSGVIAAWAVPNEAFVNRDALRWTQGQMGQGWTPANCKTEIQLSSVPGVIDSALPIFISYNVAYNSYDVSAQEAQAGQLYMNVRWTYAEGNGLGFSIQWA